MTGKDLHQLLLNKWGRSYDVQLRHHNEVFCSDNGNTWSKPLPLRQVPGSSGYLASYVYAFGGTAQVQKFIEQTRAPRLGKAVSIPLDLGERASEWLL